MCHHYNRICLIPSTRIKVADFNVSRILGPASSYTVTTQGTPGYQPLEMLVPGADGKLQFSYGVDVWGLGCTLYELVCGRMFIYDIENSNGEKMVTPANIGTMSAVVNALQYGKYPRIPGDNDNPSGLFIINTLLSCYILFLLSLFTICDSRRIQQRSAYADRQDATEGCD